jgi:adenosylmethionine-8-amino-7-oxononanoate aminotransferase
MAPLPVVSAKGAYLHLEDGRKILDGISSWWCNLHGHSHHEIVSAISKQAGTLDHVLFGGCTHPPAVELAEKIQLGLGIKCGKVFYSDNGSTAVEVALKIALQRWKNRGDTRIKIFALENAYHGDTFGAMAVGARGVFSAPFDDLLFAVERLPVHRDERALDGYLRACKSGTVAAFIFEPLVQGAGGFVMYPQSVLEEYLKISRQYGVITIADEVMTGFGRTGTLFVSSCLATFPDLICLSKGLTGGSLPLAATVCREEIFQDFISTDHSKTFFHGHTYTANPIACAAALASWNLSTNPACSEARERIQSRHRSFVQSLGEKAEEMQARVAGTILALNIRNQTECDYKDPIGEKVAQHCLSRGVLLRPLGDVLYFMPPYCVTDEELTLVYSVVRELI